MATFSREGNGLTVSGRLDVDQMDEFIARGQDLLAAPVPQVILDIRQMSHESSSLIGAVAQLGAEARSKAKSLIVRANGPMADLLVWAGLHRVVTLYVSATPASAGA